VVKCGALSCGHDDLIEIGVVQMPAHLAGPHLVLAQQVAVHLSHAIIQVVHAGHVGRI
jgi:hypothetical protein